MKAIDLFLFLILPLQADKIRDFWFNGAEISSFTLSQSRYGKNHPGHAELIFVTEPFLTARQVKDESGKGDSTGVLKLNAHTSFNTGIYSYHTMTSTFRPIDLEKFPHIIRKWKETTKTGTTTATLNKRLMNIPYWELNNPQDVGKRKELGLDPVAN
jgi:hypothetical protein